MVRILNACVRVSFSIRILSHPKLESGTKRYSNALCFDFVWELNAIDGDGDARRRQNLISIRFFFDFLHSFNSMDSIWCSRIILVHSTIHIVAIRCPCCRGMSVKMSKRVEKVMRISLVVTDSIYLLTQLAFCLLSHSIISTVIMPPSALDQLTRLNVEYPMLFKLTNGKKSRTTHAGVLEFVADEGKIYIPYWVIVATLCSMEIEKVSQVNRLFVL